MRWVGQQASNTSLDLIKEGAARKTIPYFGAEVPNSNRKPVVDVGGCRSVFNGEMWA